MRSAPRSAQHKVCSCRALPCIAASAKRRLGHRPIGANADDAVRVPSPSILNTSEPGLVLVPHCMDCDCLKVYSPITACNCASLLYLSVAWCPSLTSDLELQWRPRGEPSPPLPPRLAADVSSIWPRVAWSRVAPRTASPLPLRLDHMDVVFSMSDTTSLLDQTRSHHRSRGVAQRNALPRTMNVALCTSDLPGRLVSVVDSKVLQGR